MAGPVHPLRLIVLAALLAATGRAQPAAPVAPANASAPVSPKLARLFGGNPPKFNPPQAPDPATVTVDPPRNDIVRLPLFMVRDSRPPTEYDVLTEAGRETALARRYLGPQSTLDRNLNAVNLVSLWKSIPLLGRIPFVPFGSLSYTDRAVLIYDEVEKRRRFGELMDIELLARKAEKAPPAPKPSK